MAKWPPHTPGLGRNKGSSGKQAICVHSEDHRQVCPFGDSCYLRKSNEILDVGDQFLPEPPQVFFPVDT